MARLSQHAPSLAPRAIEHLVPITPTIWQSQDSAGDDAPRRTSSHGVIHHPPPRGADVDASNGKADQSETGDRSHQLELRAPLDDPLRLVKREGQRGIVTPRRNGAGP